MAPARTTAVKLTALAVLGIVVVLLRDPLLSLILLAVVLAAAIAIGLPLRATIRNLVPVLIAVVLAAAYHLLTGHPGTAVHVAASLLTLVLAATLVTATTAADQMLDVLTRAVRPLRHLGANPDAVALAVALLLQTMPEIARLVHEVRDAARARGLERDPRLWLIPAALRVVGRARDQGEALAARGILD